MPYGHQETEKMKAMKKDITGVSPVIAVILMVALTVVLAGVVFLWAQSFVGDNDTVDTINVKGRIDVSATELQLEVISGTYTWADYKITVNGTEIVDTTPSADSSSAGETCTWTDPVLDTVGTSYNIKIINIEKNKVVWEKDIIAVA